MPLEEYLVELDNKCRECGTSTKQWKNLSRTMASLFPCANVSSAKISVIFWKYSPPPEQLNLTSSTACYESKNSAEINRTKKCNLTLPFSPLPHLLSKAWLSHSFFDVEKLLQCDFRLLFPCDNLSWMCPQLAEIRDLPCLWEATESCHSAGHSKVQSSSHCVRSKEISPHENRRQKSHCREFTISRVSVRTKARSAIILH